MTSHILENRKGEAIYGMKMVGVSVPIEVYAHFVSNGKMSEQIRDVLYEHLRQGPWADRFTKLDDMLRQDPKLYSQKLSQMLEQVGLPLPVPVIQWHLRVGQFEKRK